MPNWHLKQVPVAGPPAARLVTPSEYAMLACMSDELLARAREQAERSDPSVRVAALLRIARVETEFDQDAARRTFEQALEASRWLSDRDGESLVDAARHLAAAVAPDRLGEIPASLGIGEYLSSGNLCQIMLNHGHVDAAVSYLIRYDRPSGFPFMVVPVVMHQAVGDAARLAVLRAAIEAWRRNRDDPFQRVDRFIQMFETQWKELPPEEALAVVHEIVRFTLEQPDRRVTAVLDAERAVRITSRREHHLFRILHILRHLDPQLVDSLVANHEQLSAAARRFPKGKESVIEEAEIRRRSAAATTSGAGGYWMVGQARDFPLFHALMKASTDGNFGPPIEHALERYREDSSAGKPSRSAKEYWPSTCAFRRISHSAGKRLGRDAADYLDRIPDADLRLFAQIELAAAIAGLPELLGIQRG
jgi:hypothetical protein